MLELESSWCLILNPSVDMLLWTRVRNTGITFMLVWDMKNLKNGDRCTTTRPWKIEASVVVNKLSIRTNLNFVNQNQIYLICFPVICLSLTVCFMLIMCPWYLCLWRCTAFKFFIRKNVFLKNINFSVFIFIIINGLTSSTIYTIVKTEILKTLIFSFLLFI